MLVKEAAVEQAQSVLETHWDGSFPVDPAEIARRLGITVRRGQLPPGTSGAIMKRPNEDAQILVQRTDNVLRQRFTIAHELGHYIERTAVQDAPDEDFGFVDKRDGKNDVHEFFANEFAGNLLAPADVLAAMWAQAPDPVKLAAFFGLSIPAIKTRLLKLNLL